MKIAWRENEYPCRNCDRSYPASNLDRRMWCTECRRVVIRRATNFARLVGAVTAGALGIWILSLVGSSPRFLMAYLVMIAAAYFFLFKLTQRVAFEIIRGRGVPPPEIEDDDG